ncbi:MAG: MarR family transcriptional regulator [Lachnospiraceae bacterium]|nr:MarR family transcriptional regulator [Lachnospiraceae bacterium]
MEELCNYDQLKLENQLCFPLYACARKIVNLYTPHLKPLGLTYTQYIVFMVLWEAKSISVKDLCKKLYLDSGTLTPLLKKMEEAGYILRARCHEDERVVTVTITEEGMALREKAAEIPAKIGMCVPLAPEEAMTMYKLLYQVLNHAGEPTEHFVEE